MKIDKQKFLEVFNDLKNAKYYNTLAKEYEIESLNLTEVVGQQADVFEIEKILPVYNLEEEDFYNWSVKTMVVAKLALKSSVDFKPENQSIEGNYKVEYEDCKPSIIYGDLIVNGNLITEGNLIVLGNVNISGYWLDRYTGIAQTVIAGNLTVGKTLLTEGNLSVGGKLNAPFVYLSYNQGFTTVIEGCNSKILIESDHSNSWIFGETKTEYYSHDELHTETEIDDNHENILNDIDKLFNNEFVTEFKPKYDKMKKSKDYDVCEASNKFLEDAYIMLAKKKKNILI